MQKNTFTQAGVLTTGLRWVVGWTYFSAFWRRLILENKLDPETAGYVGEKFNHFLPHALGIKPLIEFLVSNPDKLWWAMMVFTIVEGIVGLFFILGFLTRLMSISVLGLAMGILLGSGWLGTTCLDEWQIGILGVASGFTIFLTGGGKYTLDTWIKQKDFRLSQTRWFAWLSSGELDIRPKFLYPLTLSGSLLILALTLYTNQQFHGGVYGKLHNLSVKPHVTISQVEIQDEQLSFQVFRDEGADVYGSFLIGIQLRDASGQTIFQQTQTDLAQLSPNQIANDYVAQVKTGAQSLILPLGARATLSFSDSSFSGLKGNYILELLDISGARWTQEIAL